MTYSGRSFGNGLLCGAVLSLALAGAAFAQSGQPAPKPAAPAAKPAPAAPAQPAKPAAPAQPGQPQQAAADPQALPPGAPNPWVKLCGKDATGKDFCMITQELRTPQGQFVASVALREISGDPKKLVIVAVPPMMLIQPGMGIFVDKGKPEVGKYTICLSNACYGEVPASDALIAAMKTGKQFSIGTILVRGEKRQAFPLDLAGFKVAYDGPAANVAQAEQQKQKEELQDGLQKRAEELRKKLGDKPAQ